MPKEIFIEKFPGLDTPGDQKAKGKGMGSWGRGVHVIVGAHDDSGKALAETKHGEYEGKIDIRKSRYAKILDFENNLDKSGTRVEIQNLRSLVLMGLIDWDSVKNYIQGRFQRALENEEIEIRYSIDGKSRVVQPFDLSEYEVLFEGNLSFGENEELKDVVIYEKPSGSDIPFEGISMNKTNEYHNDPFMRIKEFTPHTVRNLDRMFGFCDASALCPEHENNAHNDFLKRQAVNRAYTALREKLNELDSEHFLGKEDSIKEKQEIVDEALDRFQDYWGEDNPISMDDGEFNLSGNTENNSNKKDEGNTGENFESKKNGGEPNEKNIPNLKLDIGSRVFETGESILVDVEITNDDEKSIYRVEGVVRNPEGEETELETSNSLQVNGHSNEDAPMRLPNLWEINPSNKGKYVLSAKLISVEDNEVVYKTSTFFYHGVNPFIGSESPSAGINISWAHGDDNYRYHISEQETGLTLYVNMSHPEWKVAVKRDGGSNVEYQSTLLAQWLQESTMMYRLRDELGEESEEYLSIREKFVEKTSEFSATNYKRYL